MFFSFFLCVLCINSDFIIRSCAVIKLVELYGHLHISVMGSGVFITITRRRVFC